MHSLPQEPPIPFTGWLGLDKEITSRSFLTLYLRTPSAHHTLGRAKKKKLDPDFSSPVSAGTFCLLYTELESICFQVSHGSLQQKPLCSSHAVWSRNGECNSRSCPFCRATSLNHKSWLEPRCKIQCKISPGHLPQDPVCSTYPLWSHDREFASRCLLAHLPAIPSGPHKLYEEWSCYSSPGFYLPFTKTSPLCFTYWLKLEWRIHL